MEHPENASPLLPCGDGRAMIRLAVLMEHQFATDGQTDDWTDGHKPISR